MPSAQSTKGAGNAVASSASLTHAQPPAQGLLMKISAVAARLQCSRGTVYNLIARGQLHPIKISAGIVRIRVDEVEALLHQSTAH
ncbi:helix-turn-helix transcriptional regulator [Variovorax sp. LT2P21]|uniref:helix-turn-helix transcriptional regulator n=1 Tax=Variovorax sp. LT2P21 TaxID=3443731 RepID=UPI003F449DE0